MTTITATTEGNMDRIVRSVEPYRAYNSKLIAGVWAVERKLVDRICEDGTTYTMDYGVKAVLAKTTFDRPLRSNDKRISIAMDNLKRTYITE